MIIAVYTDTDNQWYRLSTLGYEAGLRILSLLLLRNTLQSGGKVCVYIYI